MAGLGWLTEFNNARTANLLDGWLYCLAACGGWSANGCFQAMFISTGCGCPGWLLVFLFARPIVAPSHIAGLIVIKGQTPGWL